MSKNLHHEKSYAEIPKFWDEISEKHLQKVWEDGKSESELDRAVLQNHIAMGANIEIYMEGDQSSDNSIWIPVKHK